MTRPGRLRERAGIMVQKKTNMRRLTSRFVPVLTVLLLLLSLAAGCGPGDELTESGG